MVNLYKMTGIFIKLFLRAFKLLALIKLILGPKTRRE